MPSLGWATWFSTVLIFGLAAIMTACSGGSGARRPTPAAQGTVVALTSSPSTLAASPAWLPTTTPTSPSLPARRVVTMTGGPDIRGPQRDGPPGIAKLAAPGAMALAADGSLLVTDFDNRVIVRVDAAGNATRVAGSGEQGLEDGPALQAQLYGPIGIAAAPDGSVYFGEASHRLRRITPEGQVVTVAGGGKPGLAGGDFRDGRGEDARFNGPAGVAVQRDGSVLVADYNNHRIRMVTSDGLVTTVAGTGQAGFHDGPAAEATFNFPVALALAPDGSLYILEHGNHAVRRLSPLGMVETVASLDEASYQSGIAVSGSGEVYVADTLYNRVLVLTAGAPVVVAGTGAPGFADGPATSALLDQPVGLVVSGLDVLFADRGNAAIRRITR